MVSKTASERSKKWYNVKNFVSEIREETKVRNKITQKLDETDPNDEETWYELEEQHYFQKTAVLKLWNMSAPNLLIFLKV